MGFQTANEIGHSIKITGAVGDSASFGTLGNFCQLMNGAFAMVFDIKFADNNYNIFFGGAGGVGSSFRLSRNSASGKIDLVLIDESADHRDYTWLPALVSARWYNIVLTGTASGASGIKLYVNGVLQTITAQTNDAGFSPTASFSLAFGDQNGVNLGGFSFAKPYFYNRNLSQAEVTAINAQRIYPTDYTYAWDFKRPNIGVI